MDEKVKRIFETVDANLFWNLHARWQDEKEFENPMDYVRVWNDLDGNLLCRKMFRRPFGFEFELDGTRFKMCARIRKGYGDRTLKILS